MASSRSAARFGLDGTTSSLAGTVPLSPIGRVEGGFADGSAAGEPILQQSWSFLADEVPICQDTWWWQGDELFAIASRGVVWYR